jgi:hypothetical protein
MSFEMLKKEGFVTLLSKNEASEVRGGEHPWDSDSPITTAIFKDPPF